MDYRRLLIAICNPFGGYGCRFGHVEHLLSIGRAKINLARSIITSFNFASSAGVSLMPGYAKLWGAEYDVRGDRFYGY
jgi:hypothetical protein